jgi:methionyl-tRNA formyltransferase
VSRAQVRAFNPWPIAETRFNGAQLRIWEAEVRAPRDCVARRRLCGRHDRPTRPGHRARAAEGIDVACGSGVLRILRLQLAAASR